MLLRTARCLKTPLDVGLDVAVERSAAAAPPPPPGTPRRRATLSPADLTRVMVALSHTSTSLLKFWAQFGLLHYAALLGLPYGREARCALLLLGCLPVAASSDGLDAAFSWWAAPLLGTAPPRVAGWVRAQTSGAAAWVGADGAAAWAVEAVTDEEVLRGLPDAELARLRDALRAKWT